MTEPTNLLILLSDNHHRGLAGAYGHPAFRRLLANALRWVASADGRAWAATPA